MGGMQTIGCAACHRETDKPVEVGRVLLCPECAAPKQKARPCGRILIMIGVRVLVLSLAVTLVVTVYSYNLYRQVEGIYQSGGLIDKAAEMRLKWHSKLKEIPVIGSLVGLMMADTDAELDEIIKRTRKFDEDLVRTVADLKPTRHRLETMLSPAREQRLRAAEDEARILREEAAQIERQTTKGRQDAAACLQQQPEVGLASPVLGAFVGVVLIGLGVAVNGLERAIRNQERAV